MTGKNEQRANERQRGDGALPSFPSRFLPRDLLLADTSVHELEVLSAAPHHCDARLLGALHEVPNDAVTVLSSDFLHLAPQGFLRLGRNLERHPSAVSSLVPSQLKQTLVPGEKPVVRPTNRKISSQRFAP